MSHIAIQTMNSATQETAQATITASIRAIMQNTIDHTTLVQPTSTVENILKHIIHAIVYRTPLPKYLEVYHPVLEGILTFAASYGILYAKPIGRIKSWNHDRKAGNALAETVFVEVEASDEVQGYALGDKERLREVLEKLMVKGVDSKVGNDSNGYTEAQGERAKRTLKRNLKSGEAERRVRQRKIDDIGEEGIRREVRELRKNAIRPGFDAASPKNTQRPKTTAGPSNIQKPIVAGPSNIQTPTTILGPSIIERRTTILGPRRIQTPAPIARTDDTQTSTIATEMSTRGQLFGTWMAENNTSGLFIQLPPINEAEIDQAINDLFRQQVPTANNTTHVVDTQSPASLQEPKQDIVSDDMPTDVPLLFSPLLGAPVDTVSHTPAGPPPGTAQHSGLSTPTPSTGLTPALLGQVVGSFGNSCRVSPVGSVPGGTSILDVELPQKDEELPQEDKELPRKDKVLPQEDVQRPQDDVAQHNEGIEEPKSRVPTEASTETPTEAPTKAQPEALTQARGKPKKKKLTEVEKLQQSLSQSKQFSQSVGARETRASRRKTPYGK